MAGFAIIIILAGVAGWTLHYYKSRLDRLEQNQREQRNSYFVNDTSEDLSAVILRLMRDVDDFKKYVQDVERWGSIVSDELSRALEMAQKIRGNGTKKGR